MTRSNQDMPPRTAGSGANATRATQPAGRPSLRRRPDGEPFTDDAISVRTTLIHMILAGGAAAAAVLVCWFLMASIQLPAYSSSFVVQALSTACTVVVVLVCAWATYRWLHPTPGAVRKPLFRRLLEAVVHLAPAGMVVSTLGVPLAATRLYLDGVSVDQAFRTQFLTRMADSLSYSDMAYLHEPSFYPGLWFFTGGAFAKVTGMAAWAAYKPWALITLAATAAMLVPVWRRISGSLAVGAAIAMVTITVTLFVAPEEPYAAMVAMGLPAALILARRALHGGRWALVGVIVYLGLSANLYTLFTAVTALSVVVMALIAAVGNRRVEPILRLIAIGAGSAVLALIGWGPYLVQLLTSPHGPTGKAQHYLPEQGAEIPMPFFQSSALGVLALIAVVWLVVRSKDDDVRALTTGLVTMYFWAVLSMVMTLIGSTLLGFRLELPIALVLGTAGVIALAELRLSGMRLLRPGLISRHTSRLLTRVLSVLLAAACVFYATQIPGEHRDKIDLAYTDSDGEANRGDRFPADATTYYPDIDKALMDHFGSRSGTVVLTDEKSFMAFHPYHGYQALTAHYANPLGEFERRNQEIEKWTKITEPKKLAEEMDKASATNGWDGPDALVLRGQLDNKNPGNGEFSYLVADDIYPNQPNVRFRTVYFHASAFTEGWELKQVGPFVVAMRDK